MDNKSLTDDYKDKVEKIMENYSPLWFSITYLAEEIGITTASHYVWLEYYIDCNYSKFVCKLQSNGRKVYALKSRYMKETPWYKKVAAILANRIF